MTPLLLQSRVGFRVLTLVLTNPYPNSIMTLGKVKSPEKCAFICCCFLQRALVSSHRKDQELTCFRQQLCNPEVAKMAYTRSKSSFPC